MSSRDDKRFESFKRALLEVGPARGGSVLRRFMLCGKQGCRCQAKSPRLHGPYYDWGRKVRHRNVTVRVTEQAAEGIRERIENGRQLDGIVADMEKCSLRMIESVLRQLEPA